MSDTPLQRNGTATAPMSCEEAQLHKERLQALTEKRKRQTEIEDKRSQLDDLVLQLQHFKSKNKRERWLLQGMGAEEEDTRRKQLERDEEQGKRLEDMIHRLESEIGALESEESQISAKEQVLRQRLKETERSIEDLQKSLMSQDEDAPGRRSRTPPSDRMDPDPNHIIAASSAPTDPPASGGHAAPRPAMFAMEINVQHDPQTGEQRILSANRVSPSDAASRGVKVYDDGRKVVYEVTSSGGVSTTLENGWSSAQVDQLIHRAAQPTVQGAGGCRGQVKVTPAAPYADFHDLSPPSCAPPSIPSSPPAQVSLQRETRLGMSPPVQTQPGSSVHADTELLPPPQASAEHPVTMVFLGYQDVEDTSESRRLLGFDGAVKAEVVLIDEDDEKSLREKTVTDISVIDGTAADLVSGRPTTSDAASTELSSEGREPDSASSPPAIPDTNTAPPPGLTPATDCFDTAQVTVTTNRYQAPICSSHPHTAMKSLWAAQDVSEHTLKERSVKSVTFQESVSVITDRPPTMELEHQQIQHGCLSSPNIPTQHVVGLREQTPDSDVVQEICYLDQVLDAASEAPSNGNSSPSENIKTFNVEEGSPSICVSSVHHGQTVTLFPNEEECVMKTNGHMQKDESGHNSARFELRAFHEEKRPAKLFTPGEDQPVRVTRRRPSEEVQELERERQELIKDQAVKKNPGIAQRWWNPPQEVTLEEQLDAEQLESLRKYQERKQNKPNYTYTQPQVTGPPTVVTFDPELTRKEDIVEDQINFLSARKQFLQGESTKKDVAPHLYSAKPFSKSTSGGSVGSSDIVADGGETHVTWSDEGIIGEFTCARAVMTMLQEDEDAKGDFHPEESDSGLDELSLRSQDTTVFSLDNVSDSGASLPPTPLPLTPVSPPTPQPTTPVNGQTSSSPADNELEYRAGVLVQNAIQNALAAQNGRDWEGPDFSSAQHSEPVSPSSVSTSSPVPASSSPASSGGASTLQLPQSCSPSNLSPQPEGRVLYQQETLGHIHPQMEQHQLKTPSPPPSQSISPPPRPRDGGPRIKIQSSYSRALASSAPAPPPVSVAPVSRPTPVYRPPSPPSPEKPEFSYFTKYSEAAELRSTAVVTRGPEVEASSGPFRLRSKKQRTLSMIEEEIRAAQQREEELKKQREEQPIVRAPSTTSNSHGPARTAMKKNTISSADKMKSNSLPTKLTLTARTAPGKIEKVRPGPPISPSPSEGALSDAGSEDSGGSRHKNFMETLMEDYETHKVKRREKVEDNSVLEATRVTRRKSDMALKWEAGIYANEDGEEEEEEEEEE
ncbi:palm2 and akap2 fusion isoform X2 [Gouania willdenowi]|uniref:palm2 and akap2 fusion isoform X2 n=1 Tax=Gouania willdenowi TaxID=441366 RepID=UPI0010568D28|nr:A-kinase anchor protein 2-like isoform X2 [Gouania willdenowi]